MHTRSLIGVRGVALFFGRRLLLVVSTLGGVLACAALLALLGKPTLPAHAAPSAPAVTRTWPGGAPCNGSLQACIDGSAPGDTIAIQPNTYTTSITLSQAVSLTGVSSATVILQVWQASGC